MMDAIDIEKAKNIAETKGIRPGRIRGTEGVQLTKGLNPGIEAISWEEFEARLEARGLALFESGGWMKIMRARP